MLASDPFTNEIGLIKEEPVVEVIQEEETVVIEETTETASDVAELLKMKQQLKKLFKWLKQ